MEEKNTLRPGQTLKLGESLYSENGRFKLAMEDLGLRLYHSGRVSWKIAATGEYCVMQKEDGNFVMYTGVDPKWATGTDGTDGNPDAFLRLENDGHLVVYTKEGKAVFWHEPTIQLFPGLTMQVTEFRLSENDDLAALFPPQYQRLVVYADSVTIEGLVRFPGQSIEIYARHVAAESSSKNAPTLDVSGALPKRDYVIDQHFTDLDGTQDSRDGKPGDGGDVGGSAGSVSITAFHIEGDLTILADGHKGGNSQRGGNGCQPKQVNGSDSRFTVYDDDWPVKGPWGGEELSYIWRVHYVAWASGQPGGKAENGGNAGPPGQPGDGGRGGDVMIRFIADNSQIPTISNKGSDPGLAGKAGTPGEAGLVGIGGRNQLYIWTAGDLGGSGVDQGFVGEAKPHSDVDRTAEKHEIPNRADSGAGGATRGGGAGPLPEAQPGKPGDQSKEQVAFTDVHQYFDLDYLKLIQARARRDFDERRFEQAIRRYRWLAGLTKDNPDLHEIYGKVSDCIAHTLRRMRSEVT